MFKTTIYYCENTENYSINCCDWYNTIQELGIFECIDQIKLIYVDEFNKDINNKKNILFVPI